MEFQQAVTEALKSIQADSPPPADTSFITQFYWESDPDSAVASVVLARQRRNPTIQTTLGRVNIVPGGFVSALRTTPVFYGQSAISSVFFTDLVEALRHVLDNPWIPHVPLQGLTQIFGFSGVPLWEHTAPDSMTYGLLGVVAPDRLTPYREASLQDIPVCIFYRHYQPIGQVRSRHSTVSSPHKDGLSRWKGAFDDHIFIGNKNITLPKRTGKHLGGLVACMLRNVTDAAWTGASAHVYAQVVHSQSDVPTRLEAFLSERDARRRLAMPSLYRSDVERSTTELSAHPT